MTIMTKNIVCQKCGDIGYEEALVYCSHCHISAEHRYCLDNLPKKLLVEVNWSCEQCAQKDFTRQITSSSGFSKKLTLGESQVKKIKLPCHGVKSKAELFLGKKLMRYQLLRTTCRVENHQTNKLDSNVACCSEVNDIIVTGMIPEQQSDVSNSELSDLPSCVEDRVHIAVDADIDANSITPDIITVLQPDDCNLHQVPPSDECNDVHVEIGTDANTSKSAMTLVLHPDDCNPALSDSQSIEDGHNIHKENVSNKNVVNLQDRIMIMDAQQLDGEGSPFKDGQNCGRTSLDLLMVNDSAGRATATVHSTSDNYSPGPSDLQSIEERHDGNDSSIVKLQDKRLIMDDKEKLDGEGSSFKDGQSCGDLGITDLFVIQPMKTSLDLPMVNDGAGHAAATVKSSDDLGSYMPHDLRIEAFEQHQIRLLLPGTDDTQQITVIHESSVIPEDKGNVVESDVKADISSKDVNFMQESGDSDKSISNTKVFSFDSLGLDEKSVPSIKVADEGRTQKHQRRLIVADEEYPDAKLPSVRVIQTCGESGDKLVNAQQITAIHESSSVIPEDEGNVAKSDVKADIPSNEVNFMQESGNSDKRISNTKVCSYDSLGLDEKSVPSIKVADEGRTQKHQRRRIVDDEEYPEKLPPIEVIQSCGESGDKLVNAQKITVIHESSVIITEDEGNVAESDVKAYIPSKDVKFMQESGNSDKSISNTKMFSYDSLGLDEKSAPSIKVAVESRTRRYLRRLIVDDEEYPDEKLPPVRVIQPCGVSGDKHVNATCSVQEEQSAGLFLGDHCGDASNDACDSSCYKRKELSNNLSKTQMQQALEDPIIPSMPLALSVKHPAYAPAVPIVEPIWRGRFDVCDGKFDPIVAHLSNRACERVRVTANALPRILCFEKLPRLQSWPNSFKRSPPTDDNVALYFFPGSYSTIQEYNHILNEMIDRDLALRFTLPDAELLLYSSTELPALYQRFQQKLYLWGVFRGRKAPACTLPVNINSNIEMLDRQKPENLQKHDESGINSSNFIQLSKEVLDRRTVLEDLDGQAENIQLKLDELDISAQNLEFLEKHQQSMEDSMNCAVCKATTCFHAALQAVNPPRTYTFLEKFERHCTKMDSEGLWNIIITSDTSEVMSVRVKLPKLVSCCVDPPRLVLNAMSKVFPVNHINYDPKHEWACLMLLESLHSIMKNSDPGSCQTIISAKVRETARKIADSWKDASRKWSPVKPIMAPPFAHTFLLHIVVFGIISEDEKSLYREFLMGLSWKKNVPKLALSLGLDGETIVTMIRDLIDRGAQLHALNFVYGIGLVEQFPPVELLKSYLNDPRRADRGKQLQALQTVKYKISQFKLESEFPIESLNMRIAQLKKQDDKLLVQQYSPQVDNLQRSMMHSKKSDCQKVHVASCRLNGHQKQVHKLVKGRQGVKFESSTSSCSLQDMGQMETSEVEACYADFLQKHMKKLVKDGFGEMRDGVEKLEDEAILVNSVQMNVKGLERKCNQKPEFKAHPFDCLQEHAKHLEDKSTSDSLQSHAEQSEMGDSQISESDSCPPDCLKKEIDQMTDKVRVQVELPTLGKSPKMQTKSVGKNSQPESGHCLTDQEVNLKPNSESNIDNGRVGPQPSSYDFLGKCGRVPLEDGTVKSGDHRDGSTEVIEQSQKDCKPAQVSSSEINEQPQKKCCRPAQAGSGKVDRPMQKKGCRPAQAVSSEVNNLLQKRFKPAGQLEKKMPTPVKQKKYWKSIKWGKGAGDVVGENSKKPIKRGKKKNLGSGYKPMQQPEGRNQQHPVLKLKQQAKLSRKPSCNPPGEQRFKNNASYRPLPSDQHDGQKNTRYWARNDNSGMLNAPPKKRPRIPGGSDGMQPPFKAHRLTDDAHVRHPAKGPECDYACVRRPVMVPPIDCAPPFTGMTSVSLEEMYMRRHLP